MRSLSRYACHLMFGLPLLFGVRLDLDGNGRDRNVVEIFDRWFWVGGSLEAVEMYGIVTWASMF